MKLDVTKMVYNRKGKGKQLQFGKQTMSKWNKTVTSGIVIPKIDLECEVFFCCVSNECEQ